MRLTSLTLFVSVFAAGLAFSPAAGAAAPGAMRWFVLLSEKPVVRQYPGRIETTRAAAAPYLQHLQQVQSSLRPQIEGLHARVTGSLQRLINGIFVVATPEQAAALRNLPGVKAVTRLRRYRKADQRSISDVSGAWTELGSTASNITAGAGIRIGIIDTGIDQTHPAFQDPDLVAPTGYPIADNQADLAFTSNKVIVARSYVSDIVFADVCGACDPAAQSRPDDLTARDLDGHGTAVASVAAGMPTVYNGVTIAGVAPKAFLGNYKVFGSSDVNPNGTGNILQALEDAYSDGMDVVNLSLGSSAHGGPLDTDPTSCVASSLPTGQITFPLDACDPLAYEVENAMDGGFMTVVVSAGNQGADGYQFNYGCGAPPCYSTPTFATVGSPAYAPSAIAVGGVQNDVSYVWHVEISGNGVPSNLQTIEAFESYDGPPPDVPVQGTLVDATHTGNLCAPSPVSLSDAIVLVMQGSCTDVTMVTNAQDAGAKGVIEIANTGNVLYAPSGLAGTTIPTFIIFQSDGAALTSYIDSSPGASATLDPKPYQVPAQTSGPGAAYSVAFFSSRGPVGASGALKPDLVAAATDFLIPMQNYDPYGALFNFSMYGTTQGTSFAAPMVSGSAALVKQSNLNLTPLQIRSALVNTASVSNLLTSDGSGQPAVTEVGTGLLQAQLAVNSTLQVVPSSVGPLNPYVGATVSFGILGTSLPAPQTLTLVNTSTSPVTLLMTVVPNSSVSQVLVNNSTSASVNIPAGTSSAPGTADLTVSVSGTQVPPPGRYEGVITASGGPVPLTIPYMYVIGDGVPYDVIPLNDVEPGQGTTAFDGAVGAQIPWSGPCVNTNNNCIYNYGPVAVQVIDQFGVPVSGASVTWDPPQSIDSNHTDVSTNANGIAGATAILGSTEGPQEFTATVNGMKLPFDGYARQTPVINPGGIVDGASFTQKTVAPGSLISIFGNYMSDITQGANGINGAFDNCSACNVMNQALPMGINGASLSFDTASQSLPGRMLYVNPLQLNVQVPWELNGQTATVKSIVNYTYSPEYILTLAQYSPGFFVYDPANDVAALDYPGNQLVGPSNPVAQGSVLQLFMNGLGPVNCTAGPPSCTSDNQPADGIGAPLSPLAKTQTNPTVSIGGQPANVQFSGLAPGFVSLYQVNVQVPTGLSPGPQPITCAIGGVTCPTAQLFVQ